MSQDPPMAAGRAAMISAPATVRVEQVKLLSVTGQLDDAGLARLQRRFDELLDDGALLLLADLSGVAGCDRRLFDLLARTQQLVGHRGGWLRLVGLGPPVLAALDQADLPEVLLVYRSARWTDHGVG
jgi:anti-anti-sigma regulatory factor